MIAPVSWILPDRRPVQYIDGEYYMFYAEAARGAAGFGRLATGLQRRDDRRRNNPLAQDFPGDAEQESGIDAT